MPFTRRGLLKVKGENDAEQGPKRAEVRESRAAMVEFLYQEGITVLTDAMTGLLGHLILHTPAYQLKYRVCF